MTDALIKLYIAIILALGAIGVVTIALCAGLLRMAWAIFCLPLRLLSRR